MLLLYVIVITKEKLAEIKNVCIVVESIKIE